MKACIILLLAVFSLSVSAQNKTAQEPYLTKSLSGEAVKNVEVETSGGNITISGTSASDARIEVYVNRNNNRIGDGALSKEEIKKRLDEDYELNVSVSNGTVTAKAKPKRNNMDWKRALSISFTVYTPQMVSTNLSTSGGSISLTNLSGDQRFSTSGGNLHIEKLSGKTKGSTSGGSIYVKDSKDVIDVSTSGGNIEATNCTGKMDLSTSGGSVRLRNLNGIIEASTSGGNVHGEGIDGELNAHTSGGNVKLSGLACTLDASTSGGNIDVAMKSLGKSVTLKNSGGSISLQLPKGVGLDLDLQGRKVTNIKLENFSGSVEDDEIRGKLNGGGTAVSVHAGSGRVNLSFL